MGVTSRAAPSGRGGPRLCRFLYEPSFTAGTFTWSLFLFAAFVLTLDGVVVSHLVLGEFGHGVRWRGHREGLWWQWQRVL